MRHRAAVAALAAVTLGVLAVACGTDQDPALDSAPTPTPTTGEAPGASPTTVDGTDAPDLAGTAEVSVERPGPTALLRAVRVAGHEGFDRIVFEFEQRVPGYRVAYTEPPIREDGSGEEVQVEGQAFLEVRMEPASGAELSGEEVRQTYTGPRRIPGGDTRVVTEAVRTGDFEAILTWVLGVRARAGFRIDVLDDPARLVVDVVSGS